MDFPLDPKETLRLGAVQSLAVEKWLPSETLDRITAHARDHFRVPICLVTFIEADRQKILSRQGVEISETPRSAAFCTYTILQPEVLVVPDARKDERFKANPYATGAPFIRFYAGAPLVYEDEIRLGSLSLIDTKTRTFSLGERAELMMMADYVVSLITSRAFGLPEPDISLALST
jgi:GAF domain-containing protein